MRFEVVGWQRGVGSALSVGGALLALACGACGDDSGGGSGGAGGGAGTNAASSGAGSSDGLRITSVVVELKEPLEGSVEPPITVRVNAECPSGDCGQAAVSLGGVALGPIATLGVLDAVVAAEAAAAVQPGGEVALSVELDGELVSTTVSCPGAFDVTSPADGTPLALGQPLAVTWTPFTGAYSDLVTSCYVEPYLFDKERTDGTPALRTILGVPGSIVFVDADATAATIDIPPASDLPGSFSHLAIGVHETGPIVVEPSGGTVQCIVRRYAVVPRGD